MDRNNFVDLHKTNLEVLCKTIQAKRVGLRYDNSDPAGFDSPFTVYKSLFYNFSECTISAIGIETENSESKFALKQLFETKFSNSKKVKKIWLKSQGCCFKKLSQHQNPIPLHFEEVGSVISIY